MYKFTNGIVVFDEETKEKYIKAGYKLVETKKSNKKENSDENIKNNVSIDKKFTRNDKISK